MLYKTTVFMNIGNAIKELRQRKHPTLRQYQFAQLAGISQTFFSQIEANKKEASAETLKKICKKCDVPVAILYWYSIEESELPKNKRQAFKILKPSIDELINQLVIN